MSEKVCYCFLDTNIFLHYQTFTEINWTEELNADRVILVICSTVTYELDEKKNYDENSKIREKARKAVSKLNEIHHGNKQIRPNVELLLIPGEPDLDWQSNGLDLNIKDDRIIARIICEQSYKDNLILVSHDTGIKLKAESRGIICKELSQEKYLLPSIKTPEEEELEKLRRENALLKNSLPSLDLKLLLDDGTNSSHKRFLLTFDVK